MDPLVILLGSVALMVFLWFFFAKKNIPDLPLPVTGNTLSVLKTLGPEYEIFQNVILASPTGMMDIDFVIVSPYGVFVVNERLDSGKISVQPGQREWRITGFGKSDTINNPLWKNRQAINFLQEKVGSIRVKSLVVFVNATLKGLRDPDVVTLNNLIPRIQEFHQVQIEDNQRKEILNVLGRQYSN